MKLERDQHKQPWESSLEWSGLSEQGLIDAVPHLARRLALRETAKVAMARRSIFPEPLGVLKLPGQEPRL